ncbi:MAG: GSU2403 family nucleotidyltransferase fold protein [Woeseia sp.]
MNEPETLPGSVTVLYSELLQNCIHPLSDGANVSFKSKTIGGRRYWYLYISVGSSRREHYLGEESDQLLDRIADERALWEANEDDRTLRARLVRSLIAGGMPALNRDEGKVLALLERSGVFLAGGVLVGTLAFRAYANMLGVRWSSAVATQDVDSAADNRYTLALPNEKKPINLPQVILDSGLGFFAVPALDRRRPSTSFKIRGREFRIDVLAPMRGRNTSRPVQLKDFKACAEPVRWLDYVLQDIQPVVLLYRHGILINVPAPGRFAVHKCVVSQRRPAAQAVRTRKDLDQAAAVFKVLLQDRPGDIQLALEAAERQGESFMVGFQAGLAMLDRAVADGVRELGPG